MNFIIILAGIVAAMATLGHFTMGVNLYLNPLLESNTREIPKSIMHSLFHYVSAFQVLSALYLILVGAQGAICTYDPTMAILFIGLNYLAFGLVQFSMAAFSKTKGSLTKMFQWVLWFGIAALCFIGSGV